MLWKDAIQSRQVIPTPELIATIPSKKRKLPTSDESSELVSPEQYTTHRTKQNLV